MLTGENGILTQAQRAKTETENAQAEEENILNSYDKYINIAKNGNTIYTDENGKTAIIPKGFYIVPGLDIIDDGLVISDVQDDVQNTGNQFVWIPVINESDYNRKTNYSIVGVSETAYAGEGYLPEELQPLIPEEVVDKKEIGLLNEDAERTTIMKSGGFYISRYEAGIEGTDTLVSKKGATVWTDISWEECKETAKEFINTNGVKSALCSGIQWDVTLDFIDGKQDGTGKTYQTTAGDSSRHIGSKEVSGQNEADKVCNIYDLEGNCYENVAERNTNDESLTFVDRGGAYIDAVSSSVRNGTDGLPYSGVSFRFVLYVM